MKATFCFFTECRGDSFRVYFSKRKCRKDVEAFDVTFRKETPNGKLIAELSVIRHIVLKSDHSKELSNNFRLQVSQGAIRKLMRKCSSKNDAYDYARFLFTRFPDVEISVLHDRSLVQETEDIQEITVPESHLELENTTIGPVKITEHVVQRFHQRYASDQTLGEAAEKLHRILREKPLTPLSKDIKCSNRAQRRHKNQACYWMYENMYLVTVPDRGHQALVTVY